MIALLIVGAYFFVAARLFVTFGTSRARAYAKNFPHLTASRGVDKPYVTGEAVVMALFWPISLAVRAVGPPLWRAIERGDAS